MDNKNGFLASLIETISCFFVDYSVELLGGVWTIVLIIFCFFWVKKTQKKRKIFEVEDKQASFSNSDQIINVVNSPAPSINDKENSVVDFTLTVYIDNLLVISTKEEQNIKKDYPESPNKNKNHSEPEFLFIKRRLDNFETRRIRVDKLGDYDLEDEDALCLDDGRSNWIFYKDFNSAEVFESVKVNPEDPHQCEIEPDKDIDANITNDNDVNTYTNHTTFFERDLSFGSSSGESKSSSSEDPDTKGYFDEDMSLSPTKNSKNRLPDNKPSTWTWDYGGKSLFKTSKYANSEMGSTTSCTYLSTFFPEKINLNQSYTGYIYVYEYLYQFMVESDKFGIQKSSVIAFKDNRQTLSIKKDDKLTIELMSDDLELTHQRFDFVWQSRFNRFQTDFKVISNEKIKAEVLVLVKVDGLLVGQIIVPIMVEAKSESSAMNMIHSKFFESVFVSYSRKDSAIIKMYTSKYKALGIKVFIDTVEIKSGQYWEEILADQIRGSDVFQLFWSNSARESKYVVSEYRQALGLVEKNIKPKHFIRPNYWESPMPKYPDELRHIHFYKLEEVPLLTKNLNTAKRAMNKLLVGIGIKKDPERDNLIA